MTTYHFIAPAGVFTATSNKNYSSFNINVKSGDCVKEYQLVVRQNGQVIHKGSILGSSLQNNRIDLKYLNDSLDVNPCQYKYTFMLTPIGGISSGEQIGNPNFDGML